MKVFICLFALLAVTQARVNWNNVHPAKITPHPNGIPDVRQDEEDIERIVGGVEVVPHSRPFQVGVEVSVGDVSRRTHFCGGSLISRNYVMTAAHCCENAINVTVILGAHKILEEDEPGQIRIRAAEIIVHPGWNGQFSINDICLLGLPAPVELNTNISTIALPSRSDIGNKFTHHNATVSGWGWVSDSVTTISPVLRETSNPVLSNLYCTVTFPLGPYIIKDSHLCVSGRKGKSSCIGDTGGPLFIDRDGELTQIGILSFPSWLGCELGYPQIYTRVTELLDWIQENSDVVIVSK